ncbi:hypothetical protein [Marinicella rhabdoformis]|uniref:hypothetical protein n=1 Tax=Marinicella rhabdoformis TaxID=2580566 RepID=UPI0012AED0D6|nr:hypothetical protein [Marinicella rhabdoformis]
MSNIGFYVWSQKLSAPQNKSFTATDPGIIKLKLLSELPKAPIRTLEPAPKNTAATTVNQICYSAGPFDSEASILATEELITPLVLKTSVRKLTTTQEAGYWVYLPAMPTRAEALAKGRELAAAKVKDYYVVTAGNHENTVSLGLYREQYNADNRITELTRKGFAVQKEVRIEQWPEFWLDYSITDEQLGALPELATDTISSNEVSCQNS